MKLQNTSLMLFLSPQTFLYSQTQTVTTTADSGAGSLRQAITDINAGSDASNTINL